MRVRVWLTSLLTFLLFYLSHQTFPQSYISKGNVKGKWVKQNSPYDIDDEIKIPYSKRINHESEVKTIFSGKFDDAN